MRFIAFGALGIGMAGVVTMALWNTLMPTIFSLPAVSFWQALGMLVLSRLFFGSFGGRRRRMRFAGSMTPEERERFREAMRGKCGDAASETRV